MTARSPTRAQRAPSEGLQRRRELRRRQRMHLAAQLWSLLLLLSVSAGLGWLLLRHGWLLRTPMQVQLTNRSPFDRDQVISAAGLRFPLELLSLDSASMQQRLGANLPVENISVQRQLWPPKLLIHLQLRQAVARAQRQTTQGLETGFVDRTGAWISRAQQQASDVGAVPALKSRRLAGAPRQHRELPTARATTCRSRQPGGIQAQWRALAAKSDHWERFVSATWINALPRQLEVLSHLAEQQPLAQEPTQALDLSDPERPELVLVPSKSSEN